MEIGGETLIERSIRILKTNGIARIVIGCGHRDEHFHKIRDKYDLSLYKNEEYASTDSLYTLVLAEPFINAPFLLLESDLLYPAVAIQSLLTSEEENLILASGFTNSGDEVYIDADESGQLRDMTKDPAARAKAIGELVGISKLSPGVLSKLVQLMQTEPHARRKNYEWGLVKAAETHGIKIKLEKNLVWCEIDNEEHLKRAKELIFPKLDS